MSFFDSEQINNTDIIEFLIDPKCRKKGPMKFSIGASLRVMNRVKNSLKIGNMIPEAQTVPETLV